MKTKDEIIATAMMDWNTKHKSDDNWLKSRIEGAWKSGFKNGETHASEIKDEELKTAYQNGYEDACAQYDTLTADDHYINGYNDGLEEAWSVAMEYCFVMSELTAERVLGVTSSASDTLRRITPQEAIKKLEEWKNGKSKGLDIYVGDEVKAEDVTAKFTATFIVTHISNLITGIDWEGKTYLYSPQEIKCKTGRHFNVSSMLSEFYVENSYEEGESVEF